MEKKEINKRHPRRRGPPRNWAKSSASVPKTGEPGLEKQEFHHSSRTGRRSQGVRTGPQEGRDALRLPGTNSTCTPGRAPHTQKWLRQRLREEGAARPLEQLGSGSSRGSVQKGLRRERESDSAGPGSTGRRGSSPGSSLPWGQAEARRAQDSKDTPAPS